jgi:hypothetical protein
MKSPELHPFTMKNNKMAVKEEAKQGHKSYGRGKSEKRSWLHIDMHGISQVTLCIKFRQLNQRLILRFYLKLDNYANQKDPMT